jgi:pyruvate dehydrogenase E2 component (dihydrolipoamide acetyltransferase)
LAKEVIMPALGMAQETGRLIHWLKSAGDSVTKGEPLMEIETDKTTVEIEAPATGTLANVTAQAGDVVPVGQRIAIILAPGETANLTLSPSPQAERDLKIDRGSPSLLAEPMYSSAGSGGEVNRSEPVITPSASSAVRASPLAQRIAAENNLDLSQIKPSGGRVQKEDVLAYLAAQRGGRNGRPLASPKARRLAQEQGVDLRAVTGSGPQGAVLAADVLAAARPLRIAVAPAPTASGEMMGVSRLWQIMAERVTQAWTTIPHFYLIREVNAVRLKQWLAEVRERSIEKITVTDLLVKLTSSALRQHPRLNASWLNSGVVLNSQINVGIAVAVEDGLVVPVIRDSDGLGLNQLAARRTALVAKAQAGKLSLDDLSGGTFTISNLGMYGVDAFNAIVNPPQAAILAVSRIADRVVAVDGQPSVQPMMTLGLSCDHRVVDGARGAQFLQTLADLIENPLRMWD